MAVGGDAPVSVQSMTNTDTRDIAATVAQIHRLEKAGCEIIRVAVVDQKAADAIAQIKADIHIPLIADIHFDHRLAVSALEAGADALRINPGNIGSEKKVMAVVEKAAEKGASIRIGVNAGSLEKELLAEYKSATVEAMVKSAMGHVALMDKWGFDNFKLSIKASDVGRTVAAYRMLAKETDHPLHVGVTEAGGLYSGIVKSSLGIGMLLAEGIGDTIRVSLTRDPTEEVRVGFEILKALDIRKRGVDIISCPTCGRCNIDLFSIARRVEEALIFEKTPMKVAIMGCVVNGTRRGKGGGRGHCRGPGLRYFVQKRKTGQKGASRENGSNPFGGNR